jgi:hypothetical protein
VISAVLATAGMVAAVVLLACFVARQVSKPSRLLPLRVVTDRNRGWGMIALIVNGLSALGMFLVPAANCNPGPPAVLLLIFTRLYTRVYEDDDRPER